MLGCCRGWLVLCWSLMWRLIRRVVLLGSGGGLCGARCCRLRRLTGQICWCGGGARLIVGGSVVDCEGPLAVPEELRPTENLQAGLRRASEVQGEGAGTRAGEAVAIAIALDHGPGA